MLPWTPSLPFFFWFLSFNPDFFPGGDVIVTSRLVAPSCSSCSGHLISDPSGMVVSLNISEHKKVKQPCLTGLVKWGPTQREWMRHDPNIANYHQGLTAILVPDCNTMEDRTPLWHNNQRQEASGSGTPSGQASGCFCSRTLQKLPIWACEILGLSDCKTPWLDDSHPGPRFQYHG